MARNLHVYPKAVLEGATWTLDIKVHDQVARTSERFTRTFPAGVTAEVPLVLLKIVFDIVVGDLDDGQAIETALVFDDIKPGAQVETVWGNWQAKAESIIAGLAPGYTLEDFRAGWSRQDTATMRNDARRALVTQRGWFIDPGSVHQHEGDGSATDE